jgi:hypothetical protein
MPLRHYFCLRHLLVIISSSFLAYQYVITSWTLILFFHIIMSLLTASLDIIYYFLWVLLLFSLACYSSIGYSEDISFSLAIKTLLFHYYGAYYIIIIHYYFIIIIINIIIIVLAIIYGLYYIFSLFSFTLHSYIYIHYYYHYYYYYYHLYYDTISILP